MAPTGARSSRIGLPTSRRCAVFCAKACTPAPQRCSLSTAYYAEYLILLDAVGLWRQFETWKHDLDALARIEGVPLWDFTGFDRYSTELSRRLTAARHEPRLVLGAGALTAVNSATSSSVNIWRAHCPPDHANAPRYGVRLDRADFETHLAAQRVARDTYKAAHPDVVARD